jgi:membrane-associated phospholipid phosphatase
MTAHAKSTEGTPLEPLIALEPVRALPLLLVALALIVVAAVFMAGEALNVEGFLAVQSVTRGLPDPFWSWVTICGTGVAAYALLAPSLALQPRRYAAAIVAGVLGGIYANGMKRVYQLPRPPSVLDAAHLHVIGQPLHNFTFPSGHTVTAFALAGVLVYASTKPLKTAVWSLAFAALVATSRIAVGAHWPADLAGGAAGGWLCGALGVGAASRWRAWNTVLGVRLMGVIAIGIGVSLFVVDLGYPQAIVLQYALGVLSIAGGVWTLVRPRLDTLLPYSPQPTVPPSLPD